MTYIIHATPEAVQTFLDFTGLEAHVDPMNTMIDKSRTTAATRRTYSSH